MDIRIRASVARTHTVQLILGWKPLDASLRSNQQLAKSSGALRCMDVKVGL